MENCPSTYFKLLVDGASAKQRHGKGMKQLVQKNDGKGRHEAATKRHTKKEKEKGRKGGKKKVKREKKHFRKYGRENNKEKIKPQVT
jgi:hypothetical protein